jgi:hypothetical protein
MSTENHTFEGLTPALTDAVSKAISRNFGEYALCGFVSGSIAFGGAIPGKSDIDMVVVAKPSILTLPKPELIRMVGGFTDEYLAIHKLFNFSPDLDFPGEYFTLNQATDALNGRGFHSDGHGNIFLPRVYEDYYMEDSERWFRAWRSQISFGKFVSGDCEVFRNLKIKAWETSLSYLFRSTNEPFDIKTLLEKVTNGAYKKDGIGISDRYFTFQKDEEPYVGEAIDNMRNRGLVKSHGLQYIVNTEVLKQWESDISNRIIDGSIRQAPYLLNLEETRRLSETVVSRWNAIYEK